MMLFLIFLSGLLIGSIVAWAISTRKASSKISAADARVEELRKQVEAASIGFDGLRHRLENAEAAKVAAETKIVETEKYITEQKALLEEAKTKLTDTFNSLASEALANNNQGFLTLAEEKFKSLKASAESDLDARKTAIETLIAPLTQALATYQEEAKNLEAKRIQELGAVGQQLASLATAQVTLQNETAKLVNALRSPHIRGRWGEIALRKTAELAGMSCHCDFVEQENISTEDGRLRPDMIVKLPAGREVVVDSKVSLIGFMEALEARTDAEREIALLKHAAQVNQHVGKLSTKEYWDQFPLAPEFVVLFIPNDTFLAAAAEKDPNLIESALTKKIVIATPTTFIALLRAIAFGWRQEMLAENAQKISILGQEISDRIATIVEHFNDVGKSLRNAVESYNDATASFESRLLSSARKFKELGSGGKKEIEDLETVDQLPRTINASPNKDDKKYLKRTKANENSR